MSGLLAEFLKKAPIITVREYYGINQSVKPNDHCTWRCLYFIDGYGWYETDEHLKQRIKDKLK